MGYMVYTLHPEQGIRPQPRQTKEAFLQKRSFEKTCFQERRQGQSKISRSIIWESIWVVVKLRLLKLFGRL